MRTLHMPPEQSIDDAVAAALEEDLGRRGDITSAATLSPEHVASCAVQARQAGVIAGLACAASAFAQLSSDVLFEEVKPDGSSVQPGETVAVISGPLRSILTGERVALNFIGHLSGVATLTNAYVTAIRGTDAKICCTRKTTPGLRALEKYAVTCGGGVNHRFGLDDAILIKDNHIAGAGGIDQALANVRQLAGHMVKVEIEVDTLEQLKDVLNHDGVDAVLLDNMTPKQLKQAVEMIGGRLTSEASGGVTLSSVRAIAQSGVDLISVGALTHSAPSLDVGLDFLDSES